MRLFTIIILGILYGAEVDLFIPSFPALQKEFALTPFMVELTLAVNMISYCLTCIFCGILGDRFGRKPIIIIGLIIFIIGSIFCSYSTEYLGLLIGRFLQGVGIAAPAVLSYLILSDIYSVEKQQEMMALLNGTCTFAMAAAPVIGSYLTLYGNWRSNFIFLLLLGIISLILSYFTLPSGVSNKNVKLDIREFKEVLASKEIFYYTASICFVTITYWTFISLAPILYIQDLNVPLKHFGFYQGSLALTFAVFSLASGPLMRKFGQRNCFNISILFLIAFGIGVSLLILYDIHDPLIITLVMILNAIGVILPVNILYPKALEVIPKAKARISAVLMGSRLLLTAISIEIVSYFYKGNFKSIGYALLIMLFLTLISLYNLIDKYNVLDEKISCKISG